MPTLSNDYLRFVKQLGVEWIAAPAGLGGRPRGLVPGPGSVPGGDSGRWSESQISEIVQRVKSHGLRVGVLPLSGFPNVLLGNEQRDEDIENVRGKIRIAGRLGIPVLEYNFYWVRATEGYGVVEGRGGAKLRDFDFERIRDRRAEPNTPLPTREELWSRLTHFVKAIVPEAEKAGVRLALHPNDPPLESFRDVAQPVRSYADLRRFVDIVKSPVHGITLDTGVLTEMGVDAVTAIRYFGHRSQINHVHFRNVRVQKPNVRYTETFIDEGDADLDAAMRAFHQIRYEGILIPDHTPHMSVDDEWSHAGWAYALGYMKGLARSGGR